LRLCRASRGFVYAVTMTGTTGGSASAPSDVLGYLDRVRAASPLPVLAGFGIRRPDQVRALSAHVDGVVVGSALIEALDRGEDLREFLGALRGPTT
jgi:tryptophan synthase alpha chain